MLTKNSNILKTAHRAHEIHGRLGAEQDAPVTDEILENLDDPQIVEDRQGHDSERDAESQNHRYLHHVELPTLFPGELFATRLLLLQAGHDFHPRLFFFQSISVRQLSHLTFLLPSETVTEPFDSNL